MVVMDKHFVVELSSNHWGLFLGGLGLLLFLVLMYYKLQTAKRQKRLDDMGR